MQDQDLDWENCVWLCTDRAPSMADYHSSATSKIKKSCKQKSAVYTLHVYAVNIQLPRNCHLK